MFTGQEICTELITVNTIQPIVTDSRFVHIRKLIKKNPIRVRKNMKLKSTAMQGENKYYYYCT